MNKTVLKRTPEIWRKATAALGIAAAFIIYFLNGAEAEPSSPLALLILAAAGWLIALRHEVTGILFLLIAASALLIHPFMFATSTGYAVCGIFIFMEGIISLIKWWKK